MRSLRVSIAAVAVCVAAVLSLAGTASAHQLYQYEFEKTFTGADTTHGAFTNGIAGVVINQAGHRVIVLDENNPPVCCAPSQGWFDQFNLNGEAVNWSGLGGVSSFNGGEPKANVGDLVFDNTGHGGGFYSAVSESNAEQISGWKPDGTRWVGIAYPFQKTGLGVDTDGTLWISNVNGLGKWDPFTNTQIQAPFPGYLYEQQEQHITVDSEGYLYSSKDWNEESRQGTFKYYKGDKNIGVCCEQGFVDASSIRFSYVPTPYTTVDFSNNDIYAVEGEAGCCEKGFGKGVKVSEYSDEGQPITTFGLPEGPFTGLKGAKAVAVDSETHKVYVTTVNGEAGEVAVFKRKAPITVPDVATEHAEHPSKTTGVLKGTVNPDGVATTGCKFEWGTNTKYTKAPVTCEPGQVFSGSSANPVQAPISGMTAGQIYHYRLAAKNANEQWSYSPDRTIEASLPPTVSPVIVDQVNTDGARFGTTVNPEGGTTKYHFELGEEDCSTSPPEPCTQLPATPVTLTSRTSAKQVFESSSGLHPETPYYIRVVAENEAGEASFTLQWRTYPAPPEFDPCGNAHVRQQTSAFLLPDCRAYELVSAANAGGYEVESSLVPGQNPYQGYPNATDRVLYGLHFGSLPGASGEPPNFGRDPYVAERTETGWVSRYVGLPGAGMADKEPYGSPVLGADDQLTDFAFGGPGICNPCFNGLGTNLPLRLNGGAPQPGMVGSEEPGPSAPEGVVAKYVSADGSHIVFGSQKEFEDDAEGETPRIYERDLNAKTTQIVSTDETGATISGTVAALDVSSDGSHVLVGKKVSSQAGDTYYQLYMHVGSDSNTAKVTQGSTSGAIFDGMTADGSKVFFSTPDKLAGDTDESNDIYEVEVGPGATASAPRLVSQTSAGTPSNDDSCTPSGAPASWNAATGNGKCGAVAFAHGAGLSSSTGAFYFVSPEQLEGSEGTKNQANLYVVKPSLIAKPEFVATIDDATIDNPAVLHGAKEADTRRMSDFQVTPDGRYAVFASLLPLTGFMNLGHYEIYRYDSQGVGKLECASCAITGSAATKDTTLSPYGLNLSDKGKVFFTSPESLVLSDTNGVKDAYEWQGGVNVGRLSTGGGVTSSELLTASADGKDAFFFTRNVLVPSDENGSAIKIYDAREFGGFEFNPEEQPCAASDECHGAGTQAPPPPNINSMPQSQVPNPQPLPKPCKKGFHKRHGKCVKKKRHHGRHHRHHHRRNHG